MGYLNHRCWQGRMWEKPKSDKKKYDNSRPSDFVVEERVFLFKPAEKTDKSRKLARPFHGHTKWWNSAQTQRIYAELIDHKNSHFGWHCKV